MFDFTSLSCLPWSVSATCFSNCFPFPLNLSVFRASVFLSSSLCHTVGSLCVSLWGFPSFLYGLCFFLLVVGLYHHQIKVNCCVCHSLLSLHLGPLFYISIPLMDPADMELHEQGLFFFVFVTTTELKICLTPQFGSSSEEGCNIAAS